MTLYLTDINNIKIYFTIDADGDLEIGEVEKPNFFIVEEKDRDKIKEFFSNLD